MREGTGGVGRLKLEAILGTDMLCRLNPAAILGTDMLRQRQ